MNKTTNYSSSVHWFRRDLRLSDNAALFYALKHSESVHCVFVFDTDILQHLPPKDRRITFIWDCLIALDESLKAHGSRLTVLYGKPIELIPAFAASCNANAVFTNHDDEPAAVVRDNAVAARLTAQNTGFFTYKDHVVFERDEVMTATGTAYTVFTPYKNAWHKKLNSNEAQQGENSYFVKAYAVEKYTRNFAQHDFANLDESHAVWPTLAEMGFDDTHKIAAPVESCFFINSQCGCAPS